MQTGRFIAHLPVHFFMNRSSFFFHILFLLLFCLIVPGVSAWAIENMRILPSGGMVASQAPVSVEYSIAFDSFMTGTTFESEHSLEMYTDLADPYWTATLTDLDEESGNAVTPLGNKNGMRYRIEGWTLSYQRKQLELKVTLTGKAPAVTTTQTKTIVRVQERDEDAGVVSGAGKTVQYQVIAPAPETTATTPPATVPPVTSPPPTTAPATTPTTKQTYSPGPDTFLIIGSLSAACALLAYRNGDR